MRLSRTLVAAALATLIGAAPARPQQPESSPAHGEINARCIACHSEDRILRADPGKLPGIIDRMTAKDPGLLRELDREELTRALRRVLESPEVAAERAARERAVAEGAALFADPGLGTTGKSCSSCHRPADLRRTAARHPALEPRLGRLVSLQERLRGMIVDKLGGRELPLGDPRTVALEAYLRSLE